MHSVKMDALLNVVNFVKQMLLSNTVINTLVLLVVHRLLYYIMLLTVNILV